MTQPHHRNRHPKYRKKYKIHNWRSYERSLIKRGDLTLWLSEDVIKSWNCNLDQRFGRPRLYSDLAIETALTLRLLFKLPLRQTEGFLKSIFSLMNVDLDVPDHTTLSRRNSTLKTKLKRMSNPRGRSAQSLIVSVLSFMVKVVGHDTSMVKENVVDGGSYTQE